MEDEHGKESPKKVQHTFPMNSIRSKLETYSEQGTCPCCLFFYFQNCKEEQINQSNKKSELCLGPASRDQKSHLPQRNKVHLTEFRKVKSTCLATEQWSALQLPTVWGGWGDKGGSPILNKIKKKKKLSCCL